MNTLRLLPVFLMVGMLAAMNGCATAGTRPGAATPARAAVDVPDHFKIPTAAGRQELGPEGTCLNPIVDPRDGTSLTLIRSAGGRGDYEPTPLRYGVQEGELLRVECATGQAIGIVKR